MAQLDPEIQDVLQLLDMAITTPIHTLDAVQAREVFQSLRRPVDDLPQMHRIEDRVIESGQHSIPVRIYHPTDAKELPALVWFHGGGWVLGDLDNANLPCQELAAQAGCVVISVDYRLAPEAQFPAAYDDCLAATQWTFNNARSLGIDPSRIAVGGDSAGGNLAACVALAARDTEFAPAFQLLIYPVVNDDFDNASYTDNAEGYFLTKDLMKWFWDHYVPNAKDRADSRVSPIQANLENLPPAWLLTAGFDPLCDEGQDYARALCKAGNRVNSLHVPDTIHGFFTMPVACGARARSAAARVLSEALSTA